MGTEWRIKAFSQLRRVTSWSALAQRIDTAVSCLYTNFGYNDW